MILISIDFYYINMQKNIDLYLKKQWWFYCKQNNNIIRYSFILFTTRDQRST